MLRMSPPPHCWLAKGPGIVYNQSQGLSPRFDPGGQTLLTGFFLSFIIHSFHRPACDANSGTVGLPAAACTPAILPLPLRGHSGLGARTQDRRRRALKASSSQPPRRSAAETCQEDGRGC